jgi:hypothetical protein
MQELDVCILLCSLSSAAVTPEGKQSGVTLVQSAVSHSKYMQFFVIVLFTYMKSVRTILAQELFVLHVSYCTTIPLFIFLGQNWGFQKFNLKSVDHLVNSIYKWCKSRLDVFSFVDVRNSLFCYDADIYYIIFFLWFRGKCQVVFWSGSVTWYSNYMMSHPRK